MTYTVKVKILNREVHGHIVEFHKDFGDITSYIEHMEFYFVANEVNNTDKNRAILLCACKTETYKLLRVSENNRHCSVLVSFLIVKFSNKALYSQYIYDRLRLHSPKIVLNASKFHN